MKYSIKKIIRFALIGLAGVGVTIYFSTVSSLAADPTSTPNSVVACYPKAPLVSSAKLSNVVNNEQISYYLMSSDQSEGGFDLLISVDRRSNKCKLLLFNPMGDRLPLSRFVPMPVAQQFALQQVKQGLAEAGSKQAYQQQVMQIDIWTPEELWAIQKLGFKPPKNIKVINPEDVKVSPDQNFP